MAIAANFSGVSASSVEYGVIAEYNYVAGDTGPQIKLTFTDEESNRPTNLIGATVTLNMRKRGTTQRILSRPLYINPETAEDGVAVVVWEEGDLNVEAGVYEGEIEVVRSSGVRETLFDVFVFNIRSDID